MSSSASLDQLSTLLGATLDPNATTRRAAERELTQLQSNDSFGPLILQLTQDSSRSKSVRQSASLCFKNWIKANWAVS